jgi:hypothetical protein
LIRFQRVNALTVLYSTQFMVISNFTEQGTAFGKPQDNSQDKQAKEKERNALLKQKTSHQTEKEELKKRINAVSTEIQDIADKFVCFATLREMRSTGDRAAAQLRLSHRAAGPSAVDARACINTPHPMAPAQEARREITTKVNTANMKLKNLQNRLHQIQVWVVRATLAISMICTPRDPRGLCFLAIANGAPSRAMLPLVGNSQWDGLMRFIGAWMYIDGVLSAFRRLISKEPRRTWKPPSRRIAGFSTSAPSEPLSCRRLWRYVSASFWPEQPRCVQLKAYACNMQWCAIATDGASVFECI